MKRSFSVVVILVVFVSVLFPCLFSRSVQADSGPKPSITLEVTNAPKDYYIALLGRKGKDHWGENSELKLNEVTQDKVEAYLKDFQYDMWYFYESPLGDNLFRCNEEGRYHFWYNVPNPFRVILIDRNGDVYLSDSISQWEYNVECTFDVRKGTLDEHRVGSIAKRAGLILCHYGITLVIEILLLLGFYPLNKKNLFWVWIANTITNIPLNLFLLHAKLGTEITFFWLTFEIIIIFLEDFIYQARLIDRNGKKSGKKAFGYSVLANIMSAFAGFVFQILYGNYSL